MRPPEEADSVEWTSLSDAMGEAAEVPRYIRTMYAAYGEPGNASEDAMCDLLSCLCHDWRDTTPYPIALEMIPFLVHAVLHLPKRGVDLLSGLATVAVQAQNPSPMSGPVSAVLREAGTELLPCLSDPDTTVRLGVLLLLRLTGGPAPDHVMEAVQGARDHDDDDEVRAAALAVLARLDPDPERVLTREREAQADPAPALRLTASLAALRRSSPPYPGDLVAGIAAAGAEVDNPAHPAPFMGEPSRRRQTTDALTADPEAALTVAAHWIARGDLNRRGSILAESVILTWRDREADGIPLLAAGLRRQEKAADLRQALEALARTAPLLADPGAELRDLLLLHADCSEPRISDIALTALARCGDVRVLDERFTLPAAVLIPFADGLDALSQIGAVLLQASREAVIGPIDDGTVWPDAQSRFRAERQSVIDLIGALSPDLAARLIPELTDLLWHRLLDAPAARALGRIRLLGGQVAGPMRRELLRTLARATTRDNPVDRRIAAAVAIAGLMDGAAPHLRHDARAGAAVSTDQALELVGEFLASKVYASSAVKQLDRLGAVGMPLLPLLQAQLTAESAETRLAAAVAYWRISRDPAHVVPVAAALVDPGLLLNPPGRAIPTSIGLAALELLVEIGAAPEQLRQRLKDAISSAARLVRPPGVRLSPAEDERLRSASRLLLIG
jgi:hypothetical protein